MGRAKKRRRWTKIGSVALTAAVLGMCGFACVRSKGPTPRQVERQIRADLPVGTPRAAVEDYLHGRRINFEVEHRYLPPERVKEAGLEGQEITEYIRATVDPAFVNFDLIFRGDVVVFFLFDRAGRLLGYAFIARDWTP